MDVEAVVAGFHMMQLYCGLMMSLPLFKAEIITSGFLGCYSLHILLRRSHPLVERVSHRCSGLHQSENNRTSSVNDIKNNNNNK